MLVGDVQGQGFDLGLLAFQYGQRVRVPGYDQDLSTGRIERLDNDAADAAAAAKNNDLLLRQ